MDGASKIDPTIIVTVITVTSGCVKPKAKAITKTDIAMAYNK